jgi:myo-inositol 2-dehydrogenase/D-chiro-inositol 1-dehydrogenase
MAVRVGVIGVGRIGRMHADLLARQVPGAAVALVFDPPRGRSPPGWASALPTVPRS